MEKELVKYFITDKSKSNENNRADFVIESDETDLMKEIFKYLKLVYKDRPIYDLEDRKLTIHNGREYRAIEITICEEPFINKVSLILPELD